MEIVKKIIEKRQKNLKIELKDFLNLVKNYSNDFISESEMTLFLKNVLKKDFNDEEILDFFDAILFYSQKVDLSSVKGFKIDKHSTGGLGDKISIILLPLLVSLGIKVYKLSGKILGHTGGTVTKLNSFDGIDLKISRKYFIENKNKTNLILSEVIPEISNFEKKLYNLRSKINIVKPISLIFTSIMIKKIFLKTDLLLIDLKTGSGSYFQTEEKIDRFLNLLIKLAKRHKRKLIVVISNMDQPLGVSIGNKMEVVEAINFLEGKFISKDLEELIYEMVSKILIVSKKVDNLEEARIQIEQKINSGAALKEFKKWIEYFNGNFDSIYKNRKINCKYKIFIKAKRDGFVFIKDNSQVGHFLNKIINAFKTKIDYEAGINWFKKNNVKVKKEDIIFEFYTNRDNIEELKKIANNLFEINDNFSKIKPTIIKTVIK